MKLLGIAGLALGLLASTAAVGCTTCEQDLDCVIVCDCDGDGSDDAFYAHDCSGGVCGQGYDRDVSDGCEVLCSEDPFE